MAQQVIVVGGGLAGLSAAHTVRGTQQLRFDAIADDLQVLENGGRVLVLDKARDDSSC